VAELSGSVDEHLDRLAAQAREKWQALLKSVTVMLAPIIYLAVAMAIAIRIISFWQGYYGALYNSAAHF